MGPPNAVSSLWERPSGVPPPPPWQVPTLSGPGAADEGAGEGEGKLVASPVLQGLHTGGCAPVTCKLFH